VTGETLTIPARFNGPPGSGNGGYTSGLVAGLLGGGPAEVSLRAPAPVGRPLAVDRDGDGVAVRDGETLVAEARPALVDVEPPAPVTVDEAVAASGRGPFLDPADHPFPRCFVCGPAREEGDGLRIFAGPTGADGGALFAAAWTPPVSLADGDGCLPEQLIWAALDCPTSGPVANDPGKAGFLPIVLGRLAAHVDRPVMAGDPHVVMAWPLGVDGRKREAAAALFTADGELCARSRALWIELRSA
jgi:hypothetical protein